MDMRGCQAYVECMAVPQYLGTLAPANGASVNNTTTSSPFVIPPGVDSVLLYASAASMTATCVPDVGTLAATANDVPLPTTTLFQMPCKPMAPSGILDYANVVASYNGSGGAATVKVYALYAA